MADQFREAEATFSRPARPIQREEDLAARSSPTRSSSSASRTKRAASGSSARRSGKWYAFENGDWLEAKPPSQMEQEGHLHRLRLRERPRGGFLRPLRQPAGRRRSRSARSGLRHGPGAAGWRPRREAAAVRPAARSSSVRSIRGRFFWFFGVLGLFAGSPLRPPGRRDRPVHRLRRRPARVLRRAPGRPRGAAVVLPRRRPSWASVSGGAIGAAAARSCRTGSSRSSAGSGFRRS
ncbi:MAG: hypothetical protein MZV64_10920 [Ignavibacteriales bacterium]|nr:hypothetical protein [Ignavibacteriales bacterium]